MRAISFHFCLSILAVLWLTDAVLVPAEQAFLTDLYNSITDRPASWQLNTLATNPCPPWQGLSCTADTQHINYLAMASILGRGSIPESIGNLTSVTLINFGNNMLSGTIPSTISKLKTVTEVHFESNFLTGPLPDIGQMTALQRAYFSSNGLTGTIPASIGQLTNLIEINIASNSLSGSLPDSICNLKFVWNFLAFSNSLTGSIPSCIGNMTTLYNIQLYSNYLSGPLPTSIGQLNNLLLVHLGNNDFSGSIPESICSVKSLSYLYLYNSRFSGPIPDCIGQLQKLTDLQLYTNQLTGTIPESLWSLNGLVNFIASGNKLEGTISESVGNLTSLRIFQVFDNQLSGSIPVTIGSLGVLETVYLHNNLFSGTVPESLFGLQRMSTLTLSNNRFTGTLSPLIGQAQRMSNFQLYQNQFYGTIPAEIGQLTGLRYFYAHLNAFSGTIPDSIGNLAVLEQLYVSNNLLEGTVPPSINNLPKLTTLALAANKLEGTLPPLNNLVQLNNLYVTGNTLSGTFPDISKLINLQFLLIGGNSFSGTIPNEWTKLPKLQQISMPNNRFEGTIPSDIGDLPLTVLYLEQNLLTGTLPASIGKLQSLQSFTLTSNKLSGTLPPELGGLTSLAVVSFASNSFTGTIPREFSELQSLTDVNVGVNQFEGALPSFPNATLRTLSAANNKFSGCTPAFAHKPSVCDFTNNPLDCSCFDTTACVKFSPNECVVPLEPSAVQPDITLPLALGIALGGAVAIGAVLFGVLFSRYKNKKKGLLVELTEPDYNEVAFGKELVMKYRIAADDKYRALEDIMMNRDRTFLSILINCTASTELDMVARSLVFLAHHHNTAAELIEYFASVEILRASSENTIFRTDNMASKMFKYYSKVVGIKYLFDMLARVINELEAITKEPEADKEAARRSGVSMLNVDMEMDPNKMEEGLADKDANALQLALTCQRIITVVINAEGRVPGEFRRIFTRMQATIMSKFGSEEAVYKAVGGFLFLRFIGPSITVPHAYGLTQAPPNQRCQRQLVLIAKVIQHVANMATVTKESFMTELTDFVNKNIPKVKGFYGELLNWSKIGTAGTHRALEVPEEVRLNALAELHEFIIRNDHKMRESIADIEDDEVKIRMNQILDSIVAKYGEEPKRIGATDDKKKKGKGDTELLL